MNLYPGHHIRQALVMAGNTDYYTVLSFSFYHSCCTFHLLIEMLINRWLRFQGKWLQFSVLLTSRYFRTERCDQLSRPSKTAVDIIAVSGAICALITKHTVEDRIILPIFPRCTFNRTRRDVLTAFGENHPKIFPLFWTNHLPTRHHTQAYAAVPSPE